MKEEGTSKDEDTSKFFWKTVAPPAVSAGFLIASNLILRWTASGVSFPPIPPWLFAVVKFGSIVILVLLGFYFAAILFRSKAPTSFKVISIVLAVLVVFVGGSLIFLYTPSPVISISYPTGGIVQQDVIVYGTANNVPPGQSLWLVLYNPQLRLYYPQDHAVTIQPNGNWSGQMYIGGANDTSKQFTISAVLADNGTFAGYVRNGEITGNWPGIVPESYPITATTYDQVTVTRA
jgi:hypothetical protein